MSVLDFYKVVNDNENVEIYNKDDDLNYFCGEACDIPVKYLDFVIRHITASYDPDHDSIDYMLWV